jgi:hypothetical protein
MNESIIDLALEETAMRKGNRIFVPEDLNHFGSLDGGRRRILLLTVRTVF